MKHLFTFLRSAGTITFVVLLIIPTCCLADSLESDKQYILDQAAVYFQPLPVPVQEHEMTGKQKAMYLLGQALFFDPRLSSSQVVSCHSCHHLGLGGTDQQESSRGHGWTKGRRNSPTVFNSGLNSSQFWDGRALDLARQSEEPLQDESEMNNSKSQIIKTLSSMEGYRALFAEAFGEGEDVITLENIGLALQDFQSNLTTPNSRFDQFISGDMNALDNNEIQGLALFMDRNCASCHYGNTVGGKDFHKFGRLLDPKSGVRPETDYGRFEITALEPDRYVFRVAPLRNVAVTRPYFHSGRVWSLENAVEVMAHAQLGFIIDKSEIIQIASFLRTLTGEQPTIKIPELPVSDNASPMPVIE